MYTENWINNLPEDVAERLGQCETTRQDLPILIDSRWNFGNDSTKEEAAEYIFELMEANGLYEITELTETEYQRIMN